MKLSTFVLVVLAFLTGSLAHAVADARQNAAPVADALTAAPNEYHLEFENEFVRVTRIVYPAHHKAALHAHAAPGGVLVAITDEDARVTGQDGSTRELHYKAGQARWAVATPGKDRTTYSAHVEENLADRPFELVRIDPKIAACR